MPNISIKKVLWEINEKFKVEAIHDTCICIHKLCSFKTVIRSLNKFKTELNTRCGHEELTADQPSMFVLFNI